VKIRERVNGECEEERKKIVVFFLLWEKWYDL